MHSTLVRSKPRFLQSILGYVLVVVILGLTVPGAAKADDEYLPPFRLPSMGFYPIWENTGYLEKRGDLFIGSTGTQYGIRDSANIGVLPLQYLYRIPNAYMKFQLPRIESGIGTWHMAGQIGFLHLLNDAGRAFLSPMYESRLDNPDFSLSLIPAAVSASLEPANWICVHQTLTVLGVFSSGAIKSELTPGYSIVAELKAKSHYSMLFHAMEAGLWKHDFSAIGVSYRYQGILNEFRFGYFYRFRADSLERAPLIGFGVSL